MQMPAVNDTIVAVSSGWQASPIGIIRLSGTESFALLRSLGLTPPAVDGARWTSGTLHVDTLGTLPVTAYWFRGPRSYTGQDVLELHTVGCLPVLRELSARLIELGARRALPGEFTARAYVGGRMGARQVEGVLALMHAQHEAAARQAARLTHGPAQDRAASVVERIMQLLAEIEAGIDFVDEEGIRFVTTEEVADAIDRVLTDLEGAVETGAGDARTGKPHVAVAGLPNAGKSTLFNAMVGYERAIVSPVLGTTRDVLSADVELEGILAVVQDCAGLGGGADELELATHLAAERAAERADLVLWVHAADTAWEPREADACRRIAPQRRILAQSKIDLTHDGQTSAAPVPFADVVAVSAAADFGIEALRRTLAARLTKIGVAGDDARGRGERRVAAEALRRARKVAVATDPALSSPELVALELRAAYAALTEGASRALDEELLGRIFSQFCVGK